MAEATDLHDLGRRVEIQATNASGARQRELQDIADKLYELAGGRQPVQAGDPLVPTPGPGVRLTDETRKVLEAEQASTPTEPAAPAGLVETPSQRARREAQEAAAREAAQNQPQ